MEFDPLSNQVIGCAIEVHRELGPGLLESAYQACLAREMVLTGIPFTLQVPVPVYYKGIALECGYRMDMVVADQLVVELKCVDSLLGIHKAQIITYMKLTQIPVGLLINFNVTVLKHGLRRLTL